MPFWWSQPTGVWLSKLKPFGVLYEPRGMSSFDASGASGASDVPVNDAAVSAPYGVTGKNLSMFTPLHSTNATKRLGLTTVWPLAARGASVSRKGTPMARPPRPLRTKRRLMLMVWSPQGGGG